MLPPVSIPNLLYGSLAFVTVLVLWAWIFSLIKLLGGEIASHCASSGTSDAHTRRRPARPPRTAATSEVQFP